MRPNLAAFVEKQLPEFHRGRIDSLGELKLDEILARKNPYLFRAKNSGQADALVGDVLDAFLSSKEETVFGVFLEGIAIKACNLAYGGRKSTSEGIDLEFERDGTLYIVSIKSGPNWGNSQQLLRMKDNFKRAKRVLGTNTSGLQVVAVNGCCYGRDNMPDKGDYLKLCGEEFWSFVSGDSSLFVDLIDPLGNKAKERNEEFRGEYAKVRNRFLKQFLDDYCLADGAIDWHKIVRLGSEKRESRRRKQVGAK
ncbi:MAG: PmeII family type II restriction endonuclease [Burkholderiales bacterium]